MSLYYVILFKSQYEQLLASYNQSVQVANAAGTQPDLGTFLSQQAQLVESTRQALEAGIGPDAANRFQAYVQGEKKNMKIAKGAQ